uniref:Solute carrier family 35 member F4 n=1 Tax=Macrostomum lignano TaxID=282301 RepID=A0A1I8HLA7_9PLAT
MGASIRELTRRRSSFAVGMQDDANLSETLASSYASLRRGSIITPQQLQQMQHSIGGISGSRPQTRTSRGSLGDGLIILEDPQQQATAPPPIAGAVGPRKPASKRVAAGAALTCAVAALWVTCVNCAREVYGLRQSTLGGSGGVSSGGFNDSGNESEWLATTMTTAVTSGSGGISAATTAPTTSAAVAASSSSQASAAVPFFLAYVSSSLMAVFYPVYLACSSLWLSADLSQLKDLHRQLNDMGNSACTFMSDFLLFLRAELELLLNMVILSGELNKPAVFALRASAFTTVWMLMLYCLYRALTAVPSLELVAMFAMTPSFTYLLGWVILHRKFLGIRIIAFLLGSSGLILQIYSNRASMWLKVLGAVSGGGFAVFRTVLDRILVNYIPHLGQVLLVLSVVGVSTLLTLWPLVLLLSVFFNVEPSLNAATPWSFVFGAAACNSLTFLLLNLGNFLTYQIFVSLGLLTAVGLDFVVQVVWLKTLRFTAPNEFGGQFGDFSAMVVAGVLLIVVSFFLTFAPEGWHKKLASAFGIDQNALESAKKVRRVGLINCRVIMSPRIIALLMATLLASPACVHSLGCFVCTSNNNSKPLCDDTFGNVANFFNSNCQAARVGRAGLFPATECIKIKLQNPNDQTRTVIRTCVVDNGGNSDNTEIGRSTHCGPMQKVKWQGVLMYGCILTCNTDGCNASTGALHVVIWWRSSWEPSIGGPCEMLSANNNNSINIWSTPMPRHVEKDMACKSKEIRKQRSKSTGKTARTLCARCNKLLADVDKGIKAPNVLPNSSEVVKRRENLFSKLSLDRRGAEIHASDVIKAKAASTGSNSRFQLATRGRDLTVCVGQRAGSSTSMRGGCAVPAEEFSRFQQTLCLSGRQTKLAAQFFRAWKGRKSIEPNLRSKLSAIDSALDDLFELTNLEMDCAKGKREMRSIVFCTDPLALIDRVMARRQVSADDGALIKVGIDSGGGFLKFCVSIVPAQGLKDQPTGSRSTYAEGACRFHFEDGGVRKLLLLAIAESVSESYDNLQQILNLLNLQGFSFCAAVDMKISNAILGLQCCSSTHPCPWCETARIDFSNPDRTNVLRSIGGIRLQAFEYQRTVEEKAPRNNGGNFAGNACECLLNGVDILIAMLAQHNVFSAMPVAHALRCFRDVKASCFGMSVCGDFENRVRAFEQAYIDLGIRVTPKVHAVIDHVVQFLNMSNLAGEPKKGLGFWSEQVVETAHHDFSSMWQDFRIDFHHPSYPDRLRNSMNGASTPCASLAEASKYSRPLFWAISWPWLAVTIRRLSKSDLLATRAVGTAPERPSLGSLASHWAHLLNEASLSNRNPRDFYVIHPDWTSEALSAAPLAPPNTAKEDGRRRPWLWEHPRARELFYPDKRTQLRNRVLRDMQTEDRVRRLHTDPHYQVKHNSPWYVNNPAEVRDSNPLEKRRPLPDLYHQRPWNNARQVLARELANPVPPEARLLAANSSEMNGRTMTESEVARFRSLNSLRNRNSTSIQTESSLTRSRVVRRDSTVRDTRQRSRLCLENLARLAVSSLIDGFAATKPVEPTPSECTFEQDDAALPASAAPTSSQLRLVMRTNCTRRRQAAAKATAAAPALPLGSVAPLDHLAVAGSYRSTQSHVQPAVQGGHANSRPRQRHWTNIRPRLGPGVPALDSVQIGPTIVTTDRVDNASQDANAQAVPVSVHALQAGPSNRAAATAAQIGADHRTSSLQAVPTSHYYYSIVRQTGDSELQPWTIQLASRAPFINKRIARISVNGVSATPPRSSNLPTVDSLGLGQAALGKSARRCARSESHHFKMASNTTDSLATLSSSESNNATSSSIDRPKNSWCISTDGKLATAKADAACCSLEQLRSAANCPMPKQLDACSCLARYWEAASITARIWSRQAADRSDSTLSWPSCRVPGVRHETRTSVQEADALPQRFRFNLVQRHLRSGRFAHSALKHGPEACH